MLKKIVLGFAVIFIALQFFRPEKNLSARPAGNDDFLVHYQAPPEVRRLFAVACYDCHSNNTRYPWYAEIQPVGWWLAGHVEDAKDEINLSELGGAGEKRQASKTDAMMDDITDRVMPLKSYTLIHRDAKLSDAQIKLLTDWLQSVRDKLPPTE